MTVHSTPQQGEVGASGRLEDRWVLTQAHLRAVLAGAGCALIAVVAGRPDLLVLAAPLVVAAAWGAAARPARRPQAFFRLTRATTNEGDRSAALVRVRSIEDAELVSTSLAATAWIERRPRHGAQVRLVEPREHAEDDADDGEVRILTGADPGRWGRHTVGPVLVGALGPWGAYRWGPVPLPERPLQVLPVPEAFGSTAPAPHPRGLVGQHRSRRPGEGSEFATVRPFQRGDRLKRIHWTRSLRSRELHVTASYADQDTHVALLVDGQVDLDRSGGAGGAASSLDRTVRVAAALAEHFARQGDRVSLRVFSGRTPARLPAGTGRRHARRVRDVLSRISPAPEREEDERRTRMGLTGGTLVVVISALVSPVMLTRAATLAGSGLTVVAVDVLGEDVDPPAEPLEALAWRIRMLERDREIRRVQRTGVPVVPWRGPGSMDLVLHRLARRGQVGALR